MAQAPHRYPVGVQTFEKIRQRGYLYADKTGYIWDMLNSGGEYLFLSRPRRFGKTLLVSTMEAYFQGRKDLFEGLAIEQLDEREVWPVHPVVRFDLSTCKSMSEEGLANELDMVLRRVEKTYGRDEAAQGWSPRVESLIARAAETSDEGVVVLIDEYDAPFLNVMNEPERLQRFREIMREFYSPLKACEEYLRFVFITGISKFSQLSIFSELNNLNNISMLPKYGGICGITAEELDGPLAPDIAWLAGELGETPEECRQELKDMYDGYRFSEAPDEIYNPFSLVASLNNEKIAPYWFGSGTPTALVNMLRSSNIEVSDLEGVRTQASAFDAPTEAMGDPIAFMYQSGYLTIKDYDRHIDTYTLGIPNGEVSRGLAESLLPAYSGKSLSQTGGFVADFSTALLYDNDMDKALRLLRSFLAGIPYDLAAKDEKAFQAQLYLVLKLVGANIATEVRVATGRIDATIETPDTLFVMELKYRKAGDEHPNSADALAQIDGKGYLVPYEASGKPVVKVGVAFSEDARTIDNDWAIVVM